MSSSSSAADSSLLVDSSKVNIHCDNCKTTVTPLWRRGPAKTYLCNACGLYFRIHGAHRSLSRKSNQRNMLKQSSKNHIKGAFHPFSQPSIMMSNQYRLPIYSKSNGMQHNLELSQPLQPSHPRTSRKYQVGEVVVMAAGSSPEKPFEACALIRSIECISHRQAMIQVTWLNIKPQSLMKQTNLGAGDFEIGFSDPRTYPIVSIVRNLEVNMMTLFSKQSTQKVIQRPVLYHKSQSPTQTKHNNDSINSFPISTEPHSNRTSVEASPSYPEFHRPDDDFLQMFTIQRGDTGDHENYRKNPLFINHDLLESIPALNTEPEKMHEESPLGIQTLDGFNFNYETSNLDFTSLLDESSNISWETNDFFSLPEPSINHI